jgi:hypothetical protein
MPFRPPVKNTKTLFSLGMFSLAASAGLPRLLPHGHPDLADGLMGLFLGLAIGTIFMAIMLKARGRSSCA